jgi:Ricin-type beta-trefoil lectin domain/Glycosyl hydrolases family 18
MSLRAHSLRFVLGGLVWMGAATAHAQISGSVWYNVIGKSSAKCVDAAAAGTANGTAIQQYACNGTSAQQWQLQATSGGYYRVNTRTAVGQSWDVAGVSTADGGKIQLWAYGGGNNQQWLPVAEAGGTYHLTARHDGKCLDVPGNSTADAVQLQQWACNGTAAQSFRLQQVGSATPTPTTPATATATPGPTATTRPTATATTPTGARNMEIMTWVPSYNQSIWKAALSANTGGTYNPRNTLTRLAGQMFQVQSNGTVVQGVPDSDVQWVVSYSNANGIKFLICSHNYINDWDWGAAASAFGPNHTTLVNSLVSQVTRWGAAGVDIDFEGNLAGDPNRAEYGAFIRELGARLHSLGKELTVDIFPNIWNQPNTNWIGDWVGYVDGVNSMGYDALYGGGSDWQAYRWQQDTVLAAGYKTYQFQMGMPGWTGAWGSGGLGTSTIAHLNELNSGNYNRLPTSIAIWDAQFDGAGWLSAEVWNALHTMRMKTGN